MDQKRLPPVCNKAFNESPDAVKLEGFSPFDCPEIRCGRKERRFDDSLEDSRQNPAFFQVPSHKMVPHRQLGARQLVSAWEKRVFKTRLHCESQTASTSRLNT